MGSEGLAESLEIMHKLEKAARTMKERLLNHVGIDVPLTEEGMEELAEKYNMIMSASQSADGQIICYIVNLETETMIAAGRIKIEMEHLQDGAKQVSLKGGLFGPEGLKKLNEGYATYMKNKEEDTE